jgi:hypothetical protein
MTKKGMNNGVSVQYHMQMRQLLHCKSTQSILWKHCQFYSEHVSHLAAKASTNQHTTLLLLLSMYIVSW